MPDQPRLLHSLKLQVRRDDMDALGCVTVRVDHPTGRPMPVPEREPTVLAGAP